MDVTQPIEDIGVDTLGVRRADAPLWKKRKLASFDAAKRMLKSKRAKAAGMENLFKDRFAATTRKARLARISTLKKLLKTARLPVAPVTVDALNTIAAALKAGGYRTGVSYLTIWESLHREAGHEWTSDLAQAKAWARKSMERGLGPNRHAATVILEKLLAKLPQSMDTDMVIVGALWMLRGAELAGLLIEQVAIAPDATEATFVLGAHKTNTEAHRCERRLRCSCRRAGTGESSVLGTKVCPVHAAARILAQRKEENMHGKLPLFPGKGQKAMTPEQAREAIRRACREQALSEHSLRRTGAQFYARRGVPLPVIQYIGRWGSATVERYVAEALAGRAEWAPLLAAAELDLTDVVGDGIRSSGPGIGAIASVVTKLITEEFKKQQGNRDKQTKVNAKANEDIPCKLPSAGIDKRAPVPASSPSSSSAGRTYVRSSRTGVGHAVRFCGIGLLEVQWETECGWRYGKAKHVACSVGEVSCSRCRAALGM